MLTDTAGLALSLFAGWFAARPPTLAKSYGYYRVEILAALAKSLLLLGVAVFKSTTCTSGHLRRASRR
jgi:cobalt-zinc-cadmium efflux system protein